MSYYTDLFEKTFIHSKVLNLEVNDLEVLSDPQSLALFRNGIIKMNVIFTRLDNKWDIPFLSNINKKSSGNNLTIEITPDNFNSIKNDLEIILESIESLSIETKIQTPGGSYKERLFFDQNIIDNPKLTHEDYAKPKDTKWYEDEMSDYIFKYNVKSFRITVICNKPKYFKKDYVEQEQFKKHYYKYLSDFNHFKEGDIIKNPELNDQVLQALNDGYIKLYFNMNGKSYEISSGQLKRLMQQENFKKFLSQINYFIKPSSINKQDFNKSVEVEDIKPNEEPNKDIEKFKNDIINEAKEYYTITDEDLQFFESGFDRNKFYDYITSKNVYKNLIEKYKECKEKYNSPNITDKDKSKYKNLLINYKDSIDLYVPRQLIKFDFLKKYKDNFKLSDGSYDKDKLNKFLNKALNLLADSRSKKLKSE